MKLSTFAVTATLAGAMALQVSAHHSVEGAFDPNQPMKLTGVISRVQWTNPHIYIFLDVKNPTGEVATWALETLPTAAMRRAGVTQKLLLGDGQPVVVDAYPARDGTKNLGFIVRVTYADGHHYQLYTDDGSVNQR